MTTQEGQESPTSAPDSGVEDPAATSAGHAFWRRTGRHAGVAGEPADTETEPADTETEPADTETEPADATADPGDDEAEAGNDEAEAGNDLAEADEEVMVTEPDDDVVVAEPDDIVVAEVIDAEPARPSTAADPRDAAGLPSVGISQPAAGPTGLSPAGQAAGTGLSQDWRDIQAAFVDDPRGAVRLAAEVTDAALNGLIASLRSRQEALSGASGDTAEHRDTEQLRGELREYRVLCQSLAEIEQRLAPAAGGVN
jgi:hypothetical protein